MGLVQSQAKPKSWLTKVLVGAKNINPKWVENRRFGLKLGPEACQDRSGAFRTCPAAKKKVKKSGRAASWVWGHGREGLCLFAKETD